MITYNSFFDHSFFLSLWPRWQMVLFLFLLNCFLTQILSIPSGISTYRNISVGLLDCNLSANIDAVTSRCSTSKRPCAGLFYMQISLYWARPRGMQPYCLHTHQSVCACLLSLTLLCGDALVNPSTGSIIKPDHRELRVDSLNAWSFVNKTELVHNAIDEKKLDRLALTETFIRADHLSAIKHDPAPPGYSICHKHSQSA